MNTAEALADIDSVLANPSNGALKDGAAMVVTERAVRYQACIHRYATPGSTYRLQADRFASMSIDRAAPRLPGGAGYDALLKGVLAALRSDVANGKLRTFEEAVRGEAYSDLIAQGAGLNADGFSRAAAVLVGAALEEHIKKLAAKNQIPLLRPDSKPRKAADLNTDLKKANVYAEAQRATVESWQKLRNDAAHGDPGFDGPDTSKVAFVPSMIDGVRAFIAQYVA